MRAAAKKNWGFFQANLIISGQRAVIQFIRGDVVKVCGERPVILALMVAAVLQENRLFFAVIQSTDIEL